MSLANHELTPLQRRVLALLAGLEPGWVLTGGAALAGFHLGHRTTRDLDLFFRGLKRIEPDILRTIESRLEAAGLVFQRSQRSEAFVRYQVSDTDETVVLDLVAEPVPAASEPDEFVVDAETVLGSVSIRVDSRYEIFVNKLNALVSRTELRDLIDLERLVTDDETLVRALRDAARKDGGFSPLILAACLTSFPVRILGSRASLPSGRVHALDAFAKGLGERVARAAYPQ